jgi:hypothetical protein
MGKLHGHERRSSIPDERRGRLTRRLTIGACLVCIAVAGCTSLRPTPASPAPSGAPDTVAQGSGAAASSAPSLPTSPAGASAPSPQVPPPSAARATEAVPAQASGAAAKASAAEPSSAKTSQPPAKNPAKPSAPPAARAASSEQAPVGAAEKLPAAPSLDLAALEERLKDTHAIGVFTKLSLKNQVDDLLDGFRAFHQGQGKPPLTQLRQQYDLLLLKVLTLLQDTDQQLAAAISSSREAIWGILTDPQKFAKI